MLPVWLLRSPASSAGLSVAILALLTAGEFLERYLYFAAVAAPACRSRENLNRRTALTRPSSREPPA